MQDITLIAQSCIAAAGYSLLFYFKKRQKSSEPFKWRKAASTVVIGVVVGLGYATSGVLPSQADISAQLATMGATIAAADQLMKILVAQLPKPASL